MNNEEYTSLVRALNMKEEHLEQATKEVLALKDSLMKAQDRRADLFNDIMYLEEKRDKLRWEANEITYERSIK